MNVLQRTPRTGGYRRVTIAAKSEKRLKKLIKVEKAYKISFYTWIPGQTTSYTHISKRKKNIQKIHILKNEIDNSAFFRNYKHKNNSLTPSRCRQSYSRATPWQ